MTASAPPPRFAHGNFVGRVHAEYESKLDRLLPLLQFNPTFKILKEGRARKVWVAESEVGPLCVKEYLETGLGERISATLRGSRARREWRRLLHFHGRGVPVPEPILIAEDRTREGNRRSLVVLRFIPRALSLSEILASPFPGSAVQERAIQAELGTALARMHKAGGLHHDLHPGNVLVSETGKDEPRVHLIDLHQVSLRGKIPWHKRLKNLARLLGGESERLGLACKHRILKAYLIEATDWRPPFWEEREARRSMGRAIEERAREYFARRWRGRVDKCMEEGKRFHRLKVGEYSGWIREGEESPELRQALTDPNGWLESERCRILKHNATTTVARAAIPEENRAFFVKRYNRKDVWERTKNLFRYSRALKVWRAGYALEILGIPTPRVICAIEKRKGPLVLEAFILTDWLEGGVGLDDFYRERCDKQSGNPLPERDRRKLEKTVARLFAHLHWHRISHGDLKGRNVLLDPSRPAPFDPRFVDLDAMTLSPRRFRRARINDLSRLLFSVYPIPSLLRQVRFFKDYSRGDKRAWENRRQWFGRIRNRTNRKLKEKGLLP